MSGDEGGGSSNDGGEDGDSSDSDSDGHANPSSFLFLFPSSASDPGENIMHNFQLGFFQQTFVKAFLYPFSSLSLSLSLSFFSLLTHRVFKKSAEAFACFSCPNSSYA